MAKIRVILMVIFLCSSVVLADEGREARIQELIQETQKVDQMILQYQSEVNRLTQIKMENIGRIKELQRKDKKKDEKLEKKEKNDKKNR